MNGGSIYFLWRKLTMSQKISLKSLWCCIVFVMLSSILCPLAAYAVPACDRLFELKQTSGLSFEARQRGDEWHNWVETRDGYGIHKNAATGNWEYYLSSNHAAKVRTNGPSSLHGISPAVVGETDPASLNIPKGLRPPRTSANGTEFSLEGLQQGPERGLKSLQAVSGTMHLLVIGVDYANEPATYTANEIQPRFFGSSDSVSDYYNKTSYSAVTIAPAIESHGTSNDGFIGWLRLDGKHPNTGGNTDSRNQQIAKDAILAADPYIDYAQYDENGNNIVEPTELSIIIIVAGYEAAYEGPILPSIWAHRWNMRNVGFPVVDGETIELYAQFGEKHGNHLATFGVMAHELGHLMFTLPDLYDTDLSNGDSMGVGAFDLMGTGSWGARPDADSGSSPTQLSAWSKEYLSWGTVNTISFQGQVSFPKSDGNSASVFRINTSDANQYFLLENRQFSGYDMGFLGYTGNYGHGGLVIYHIDRRRTSLWPNFNIVNADENDKGVDVEEANEGSLRYSMLDTNESEANTNMFFFSGNNDRFTDTTTPDSRLKNGNPTDISITDISTFGDTMTAIVNPPEYTVPYVSAPMTVDGELDESAWGIVTDISRIVLGATDNTAKFGILWDSYYLYVGVKALDNNLSNDSRSKKIGPLYDDDSVEIVIDGDHNRGTTYDSHDRYFLKGWNNNGLDATGTKIIRDLKRGVLHGWATIPGGYSIEIAIPWTNLGITPAPDKTIGFSVGYNDDDNGGPREALVVWQGTGDNYKDTSALGEIVLGEAPTPRPEIINDLVTFNELNHETTSDTFGCGGGKFILDAKLTNKSDSTFLLSDLVIKVLELTNGNLLENADGGAGGVGASLTVPQKDNYVDGVLSPGESVDVQFIICLNKKKSFRFVVDVLGVKETGQKVETVASLSSQDLELVTTPKSRITNKRSFFGRFRP
ncbi:MAG: M6 family metalloprotease domain-containing protein [wastewater metagenome]|nr:M6 family metalloprotease domain-containing protein [Candidatus Loosdrechtia aerotolerans]